MTHTTLHWAPLLGLLLSASSCTYDEQALVPPTVDEDSSLPALEINGTKLHAEAFGDPEKPLVVFLHGGPGGDYRSLVHLRTLADEGFHTVFFDHRGAGLSRRHDCDEITADNYIGDLEAVVDHYARSTTKPVAFVGISWGSMYATWYTDRHPERVRAVVLGDPAAFTREELDEYFSELFKGINAFGEVFKDGAYARRFLTPDDHARADFLMLAASPIIDDKVGIDPDRPEPLWRHGAAAQTCLLKAAGDFDWTKNLSRYQGRALIVSGEKNKTHTVAHNEKLAAHYPNARTATIAGVGHDMFYNAPEQSLALIRAELNAAFAGGAK